MHNVTVLARSLPFINSDFHKMCVSFFPTAILWNIFRCNKYWFLPDMHAAVHIKSSCNTLRLTHFEQHWNLQMLVKHPIQNLSKIHSSVFELLVLNKWTHIVMLIGAYFYQHLCCERAKKKWQFVQHETELWIVIQFVHYR